MRKDRSVSEIIGAVLLFVIVISLITTYMTWYVPLSDRNAQQGYYESEASSLSAVSSEMISTNSFSQRIPMGIDGPIGNHYPTSLAFTNKSLAAALFFNLTVQTFNGSAYTNNTIGERFLSYGSIIAYPSTSFLPSENFVLSDGIVTINDLFYSSLPVSIANGSISLSIINMSGPPDMVSSYSSGLVQGNSYKTIVISESLNSTSTAILNPGRVSKITLDSMNYSVYVPSSSSLFDYIYISFNASRMPPPSYFDMYGFNISMNPSFMSIKNLKPVNLNSFLTIYKNINIEEN